MTATVVGAATREKLGYRPGLDGVRGVAVALVVLAHLGPAGGWGAGSIGVGVFFTLSGFLITTLLLEEHGRTGGVALGSFWKRRARRLLPALGLLLVVWFAVERRPGPVIAGALYGSNYARLAGLDVTGIGHLWSLAVEEHFYVLWPLLFIAVRRDPLRIVAGLYAVLFVWRLVAWQIDPARVQFATDTRAGGILAGCLLAYWVQQHGLPRLPRWALLASIALAGALWAWGTPEPWFELETLVGLVWICAAMTWVPPRPVIRLGMVSYGVYLWHFPIIAWVGDTTPAGWVVVCAFTSAAVAGSWQVERRWLKPKAAVRVSPVPAMA